MIFLLQITELTEIKYFTRFCFMSPHKYKQRALKQRGRLDHVTTSTLQDHAWKKTNMQLCFGARITQKMIKVLFSLSS